MDHPYLHYCRHDSRESIAALGRFLDTVPANLDPDDSMYVLYDNAEAIWEGLQGVTEQDLANSYANQVLKFLDPELLDRVDAGQKINQVLTSEADALAVQLLYVAGALGVLVEAAPYSGEEILAAIRDENIELDMVLLAATFGQAILSGAPEYAGVWRILDPALGTDLLEPFDWEEAFLFSLGMHSAWSDFPTATERDRQHILQFYFYRAIASGISVKSWLSVSYPNGLPATGINSVLQPILASVEIVPQDTLYENIKKFSDVAKEFISTMSRASIPTLAQEEYLSRWYVGNTEENVYRDWLRESLGTLYRIQSNTLNQ